MKKIFLLLFILSNSTLVYPDGLDSLSYLRNPNYKMQMDMQSIYKTRQADIVMLGNSLTAGANWNELLGRSNVAERGIPGDIVEGFLSRLDNIYKLKPKVCFILGGVNDIFSWIPVDQIFQNYLQVINNLKARNITVVIQSTTYSAPHWGKEWLAQNNPELDVAEYNAGRNKEVDKLNDKLRLYSKTNNIIFVELNSKLSRGNYLRTEHTYDGIHLNAKGYEIWGKEVDKVLKNLGM